MARVLGWLWRDGDGTDTLRRQRGVMLMDRPHVTRSRTNLCCLRNCNLKQTLFSQSMPTNDFLILVRWRHVEYIKPSTNKSGRDVIRIFAVVMMVLTVLGDGGREGVIKMECFLASDDDNKNWCYGLMVLMPYAGGSFISYPPSPPLLDLSLLDSYFLLGILVETSQWNKSLSKLYFHSHKQDPKLMIFLCIPGAKHVSERELHALVLV
ncbi:hypothetical protein VNO78_16595 [Psophocarpus tetragonolobus]|uniref:Uncharacterized protein n=1 Tax=Psophocarpus tetragonolobus TaxID=3891 RepID=A0AAN9SGF5_PSOTE